MSSESTRETTSDITNESNNESNIQENKNKFRIVLCAIYDKKKHGFTADSDPNIHGQYLVLDSYRYINSRNYFKIDDNVSDMSTDSDDEEKEENIYEICEWYNKLYEISFIRSQNQSRYTALENAHLRRRPYFIKPEIAECFYLSGQEKVAILKTFWLRLIQRTWKKIFVQRKEVWEKRKQVCNILYWQMRGTWPNNCRSLPDLH